MDDMMKKLNGLLSDEESVRQLSELAEMISSETREGETSPEDDTDIADMLKIGSLLSSMTETDSNTELLMALRPHLKEERQKRVDKAVKLMKLLTVLEAAKENGMLSDLI